VCVFAFGEKLVGRYKKKIQIRVVFGSIAGDSDVGWYRWLPRLSEFFFWDY